MITHCYNFQGGTPSHQNVTKKKRRSGNATSHLGRKVSRTRTGETHVLAFLSSLALLIEICFLVKLHSDLLWQIESFGVWVKFHPNLPICLHIHSIQFPFWHKYVKIGFFNHPWLDSFFAIPYCQSWILFAYFFHSSDNWLCLKGDYNLRSKNIYFAALTTKVWRPPHPQDPWPPILRWAINKSN